VATALDFHHANFRYKEVPVLVDVSLRVEEGECVAMIGPNGGGKSTMLKLALGLLKPDSGTVQVFHHAPHTGCRLIGYVPQHLHFDPKVPVTCLEVVLMGRLDRLPWWGRYSREDLAAAGEILRRVGLVDIEERPFASLSGGQKQRVLIARALFTEPRILLLDEPTANVDLTVEERFVELLEELRARVTIVLVTHDLGLVERLTDQVICVNRRVHRHRVQDLDGETLRQIYSAELREQHFGPCACSEPAKTEEQP
jgi:zinc transport system ATP-binding protein